MTRVLCTPSLVRADGTKVDGHSQDGQLEPFATERITHAQGQSHPSRATSSSIIAMALVVVVGATSNASTRSSAKGDDNTAVYAHEIDCKRKMNSRIIIIIIILVVVEVVVVDSNVSICVHVQAAFAHICMQMSCACNGGNCARTHARTHACIFKCEWAMYARAHAHMHSKAFNEASVLLISTCVYVCNGTYEPADQSARRQASAEQRAVCAATQVPLARASSRAPNAPN